MSRPEIVACAALVRTGLTLGRLSASEGHAVKVLQTIGRHSASGQEGIFQYKRTVKGVFIDSSVGRAALTPDKVTITHDEWTSILKAIEALPQQTFRLTRSGTGDKPTQSMYDTISSAVPSPAHG